MKKNQCLFIVFALLVLHAGSVCFPGTSLAKTADDTALTIIKASEDSTIKVTSPQNVERIIKVKNEVPPIGLGDRVEVLQGNLSIGYRGYTINLPEKSVIIRKSASLTLSDGTVSIEHDHQTVNLKPGESFEFE